MNEKSELIFNTLSMPRSMDDFNKIDLVNTQGQTYKEFKNTLKPRWIKLWLELLAGYGVLIATLLCIIQLEAITALLPFTILISAFILGFALAYIQLFFHEAAHSNIAHNRKWNDFLANVLIGIFVGQDIKTYRPLHFQHHLKLGTPEDPERTYFHALTWRFILESLTGIRVIKVLFNRKKIVAAMDTTHIVTLKKIVFNKHLMQSILFHSLILSIAIKLGHWPLALAWFIGMGVVMPFFAAIRPVLEHRDLNAKDELDYHQIPHGSIHRLFGNGLLACTLGGAGFNRHLLHHWEPQISYTQLARLEKFLLQTKAADCIRGQQTHYLKILIRLMRIA
jgi:fatty acid desaturase